MPHRGVALEMHDFNSTMGAGLGTGVLGVRSISIASGNSHGDIVFSSLGIKGIVGNLLSVVQSAKFIAS